MAENQVNETLNRLLIVVGRSLIQYTGECRPWTGESAELDASLDNVVQRQQGAIRQIVELLSRRGVIAQLGAYPDYSPYHYISLDFLSDKLVAEEEAIIAQLERSQPACSSDPEVATLLADLLAEEHKILQSLQDLVTSNTASPATK